MKLNNRGVIISTLLFGTLTILILVLVLLLGLLRQQAIFNKRITTNIERDLNRCVMEEVELEMCYYSGNSNCNRKKYENCRGVISDNIFLLSDVVSVGDYVDYDAGIWNESNGMPDSPLLLGGYTKNSSKNYGVSCSGSQTNRGWRVLDVTDGVVTLVHAGTPECFNFLYDRTNNRVAYNAEVILKGTTEGVINNTLNSVPHNFNNYIINRDYASSVSVLGLDDLSKLLDIDNLEDGQQVTNNLIAIGANYYLASAIDANHLAYIYVVNNKSYISLETENEINKTFGIRPIVRLRVGVETTGQLEINGVKTWILY